MNNHRIRVSSAKRLEDALASTGFPSRRRHLSVNIHFYHQMAMATHGVRRGGAAAIDLAYVACGRLDAFWEFGLQPWDMAAGTLLVSEAGGRCSDMKGGPHGMPGPHLLTTNGAISQETLDLFDEAIFRGQFRVPIPHSLVSCPCYFDCGAPLPSRLDWLAIEYG